MKEETGFNVRVTNICKGVAILIMLIHHIFPGMEGFGLKVGQTWIMPQIAILGKVCVSIFLFLSGYGLQESCSKKKLSVPEFYKKRFLSLYIPYWMVFVIFISIGFLVYPVYLNNFLTAPYSPEKNLVINFLGLQYFFNGYMGINPSWWFFSQIALLYLLYPLLRRVSEIKTYGSVILGLLCFLFSFYVHDLNIDGFYVNFMWFTPFIIGMLFSQHKVFEKCTGLSTGGGHFANGILFVTIIALSFLRIRLGADTRAGLRLDFVLAPLYCFFLYRLYCQKNAVTSILFDILAYLGVHSGNIYYIHLFITNMYTTPYIYGLNAPFFMITATIAACLPFSIVIEKTKKALLSRSWLIPKLSNNFGKRSSCEDRQCRELIIVRWMFTIVFATLVFYSFSPLFSWGVLLDVFCYTFFALIGYLLYPFFAGNFCLEIAEKTAKARSSGLDLLRVLAVILVMLIHYIAKIGYYGWNAQGTTFIFVSFLRWFSSACCPLFMLLTGYFAINKPVDRKSWKAVPSFLFSYFVLSIMHVCYLWHAGTTVDLSYVKQLVNMNAFWYVNMHFGLMLIAPFCNLAWNNLTCRYKQMLIVILFALSSFGTVTDGYFTQYWYGLYPLLYYFVGGFIRQYKIKGNKLFTVASMLVILTLQTIYTYFVAEGSVFDWNVNYGGYSSGYNAAPTVIVASLLMIAVKDITIKNKYINYILLQISKNSLVIYLASCMFVTSIVHQKILPLLGLRSLTMTFFAETIMSIIPCVLLGSVINRVYVEIINIVKIKQVQNADKK